MARIKFVKKAQQRYATKPVLDDQGQPKRVPLTRGGEQLTTKSGSLRWLPVTERDLSRPLSMPTCDLCRKPIEPGQSYRWVKLRTGKRFRHADEPTWQPWDLSSSMANRIAQSIHGLDWPAEFDDTSDVASVLESLADEVDGFAEERREASQAIVDGFGHDTEMSENLRQHADDLEQWASDLRGWSFSGDQDAPDEDDEDALEAWREEVLDDAQQLADEIPDVG